MRIVDRVTFLAMPKGTVYAYYKPCVFDDLCIKDDTLPTGGVGTFGDWFYQQIADSVDSTGSLDFFDQLDASEKIGSSLRMDFDCLSRNGLFAAEQLFAVWEPQDVRGLIHRLQRALADVEGAAMETAPTPDDPRLTRFGPGDDAAIVCGTCGANVGDIDIHTAWHKTAGHLGQHPRCGTCAAVRISAELGIEPDEPVSAHLRDRHVGLWNAYMNSVARTLENRPEV